MEQLTVNLPLINNRSISELPVINLKEGVFQPRKDFPKESLDALAESIKREGILVPLLVRPLNKTQYEIIAGERRWRAAQIANIENVPCLVKNYSDEQAATISLIENISRENLDPIAESYAIDRIINEFNYTHEEVSAVIGKPRSVVSNLLRLLKLDKRVQDLLKESRLSVAHCKILGVLPNEKQYWFAIKTIEKSWSTRALESAIKNLNKQQASIHSKSKQVMRIEREVSDTFGHPVTFKLNKNKSGSVNISFQNYDMLNAILAKLGYENYEY